MKYLYALLFLFAVSTFQSQAQRNFKPGYIVTLKGDTTKGFVDYKEWNENPREISFKTTDQAASQQYSPDNIKAFGVNEFDHYKAYSGPLTKGAVQLSDLSSGIDSSFVNDNVFLRVITGGKNLTLYEYRDKIKTRLFIAEGRSTPAELRRYVYLDDKQSDKIREYNFYTQQLLAWAIKYTPDNEALTARINSAPYRSMDIKDIVFQLNNSTENYKTSNAPGGSSEFFIGVGANMTKASFFGTEKLSYVENMFTANTSVQSIGPVIAAGMNFYFNKNVKKFFFKAELNLTMNKIKATYSGTYTDYMTKVDRVEELTFNQINISAVPQLAYNIYNTDNLKVFVAAGFQINFSSFSNTHYYGTNTLNGNLESTKDSQLLYRKMSTSITGKSGVTIANKFEVYFGYGVPVSITEYANYGIDLSYYRFGVNYLFGKK